MAKGHEERISELIIEYKYLENKEKNTKDKWTKYIIRDEIRTIKKQFLKEFHQPIEKFF